MTIQVVNIGTAAGNRTGTVGRTAMADVVNNDIELYARSGVTSLKFSSYPWTGTPTVVSSTYATVNGATATNLTDMSAQLQAAVAIVNALNITGSFSGAAYELVIDLPIYVQVGTTIANAMFLNAGFNLTFTKAGLIFTDCLGVPLFCANDVNDVTFQDMRICYIPHPTLGSYGNNGAPATTTTGIIFQAVSAFAAGPLRTWLINLYASSGGTNGNTFAQYVNPAFAGSTNGSAIICIKGASSRISFRGLTHFFVPDGATADQFIPCPMRLDPEFNPGLQVTSATPQNGTTFTWPLLVTIDNMEIDGYMMGLVGAPQNCVIKQFTTRRYTDLQANTTVDPTGQYIGGNGQWFSPPHDIYFNTNGESQCKYNINARSLGPYVGIVTRRAGLFAWKFTIDNGSEATLMSSGHNDGGLQILSWGNPGGGKVRLNSVVDTRLGFAVNSGAGFAAQGVSFGGGSNYPLIDVDLDATVTDIAPIPAGYPVGSDLVNAHSGLTFAIRVNSADWPSTAYQGTSLSGNVTTSTYPTNNPGFGIGGSNIRVQHWANFAQCTSLSQYKGTSYNVVPLTNSSREDFVSGWRTIPLNIGTAITFTSAPAANATTATLTASLAPNGSTNTITFSDGETRVVTISGGVNVSWTTGLTSAVTTSGFINYLVSGSTSGQLGPTSSWAGPTGTLPIAFSDGSQRWASLTNGSVGATVSWTLPLVANVSGTLATPSAATCCYLSSNLNAFRQRMYTSGGIGSHVRVVDVSNAHEQTVRNARLLEEFTIVCEIITTAATTITTPLVIPSGYAVVGFSFYNPGSTAPGATSSIGWSGNTAAIATGLSGSAGFNGPNPVITPVPVTSQQTVLLTGSTTYTAGATINLALDLRAMWNSG